MFFLLCEGKELEGEGRKLNRRKGKHMEEKGKREIERESAGSGRKERKGK